MVAATGEMAAGGGGGADWSPAHDRWIYLVWLGLLWVGMIAGFSADLPRFLAEKPAALPIVHLHAAIYVAWLGIITAQIALVVSGRIAEHRRLGRWAAMFTVLMVVSGITTALTTKARAMTLGRGDFAFLSVNFVNMISFAALIGAGVVFRNRPAAHKRLMMLANVALADPGFSRFTGAFIKDPTTVWPWFWDTFYGNVLLVVAMTGWDLWRRRTLHPAFILGAVPMLAGEYLASWLYFDPAWKAFATSLVKAWPYVG